MGPEREEGVPGLWSRDASPGPRRGGAAVVPKWAAGRLSGAPRSEEFRPAGGAGVKWGWTPDGEARGSRLKGNPGMECSKPRAGHSNAYKSRCKNSERNRKRSTRTFQECRWR